MDNFFIELRIEGDRNKEELGYTLKKCLEFLPQCSMQDEQRDEVARKIKEAILWLERG